MCTEQFAHVATYWPCRVAYLLGYFALLQPVVIADFAPVTSGLFYYSHIGCREVQPYGWARRMRQAVVPPPALVDFVTSETEVGRDGDDASVNTPQKRIERAAKVAVKGDSFGQFIFLSKLVDSVTLPPDWSAQVALAITEGATP